MNQRTNILDATTNDLKKTLDTTLFKCTMYNMQTKELIMSDNYPPGAFAEICSIERNAQNYDELLKENEKLTKWYYLECAKNDEPDFNGHKVCYHIIDEINEQQDAIKSCIRDVMKSIAQGKSIIEFNSFELLVYQCFIKFVDYEAQWTTDKECNQI